MRFRLNSSLTLKPKNTKDFITTLFWSVKIKRNSSWEHKELECFPQQLPVISLVTMATVACDVHINCCVHNAKALHKKAPFYTALSNVLQLATMKDRAGVIPPGCIVSINAEGSHYSRLNFIMHRFMLHYSHYWRAYGLCTALKQEGAVSRDNYLKHQQDFGTMPVEASRAGSRCSSVKRNACNSTLVNFKWVRFEHVLQQHCDGVYS